MKDGGISGSTHGCNNYSRLSSRVEHARLGAGSDGKPSKEDDKNALRQGEVPPQEVTAVDSDFLSAGKGFVRLTNGATSAIAALLLAEG